MARNSDTGDVNNIDNFQKMINEAEDMGALYQPTNDLLKLTALLALIVVAKAAVSAIKTPKATHNREAAERAELFKPLGALITRLLNMFYSTDAPQKTKDYAKTIADKIRSSGGGSKADESTPPPTDDPDAPAPEDDESRPYSTSQRSYVRLADNFEMFISILKAEPTYQPNEEDLKIAALETLLASFKAKNGTVELALKAWKKTLADRNAALYAEKTGLVDVALAVKKYVRGAVGTANQHFKNIKGLKFTRPRKGK